jgi:hypothetical protein
VFLFGIWGAGGGCLGWDLGFFGGIGGWGIYRMGLARPIGATLTVALDSALSNTGRRFVETHGRASWTPPRAAKPSSLEESFLNSRPSMWRLGIRFRGEREAYSPGSFLIQRMEKP